MGDCIKETLLNSVFGGETSKPGLAISRRSAWPRHKRYQKHYVYLLHKPNGAGTSIMNEQKDGAKERAGIPAADIQSACDLILTNDLFLHSPRMSRLLRFLVDKAISRAFHDTNEYVIGIEVFDRKPPSYNTSEDPIVRVQIGRLREKLKAYYAKLENDSDIEISIPVGSYMPIIRRKNAIGSYADSVPRFAVHPFKCISHCRNAKFFAHGLYDELVHQLYKAFGKTVVTQTPLPHRETGSELHVVKHTSSAGINHRLEGVVKMDTEHIRTSVRLIEVSAGYVAWSEQFNCDASFAITHQEELATSICKALRRFFHIE